MPMTDEKRGTAGGPDADRPSAEEQTERINASVRLCYHCCKPIEGRAFLVSLKGRSKATLCVKRASHRVRGMHEPCAHAWIEQARLSADLYPHYPEIAEAHREYIGAVARGFKNFEAIRDQISARNDYLSSTIRHHYRRHIEALKTGGDVPPPNLELLATWKSWATKHFHEACVQIVKYPLAAASETSTSLGAAPGPARDGSNCEESLELPTQKSIDEARYQVKLYRSVLADAETRLRRLFELSEAIRSRAIIRFPGKR